MPAPAGKSRQFQRISVKLAEIGGMSRQRCPVMTVAYGSARNAHMGSLMNAPLSRLSRLIISSTNLR